MNLIVRCTLSCDLFKMPEEVATQLAVSGLKKKALRTCSVAVFGAEEAIISVAAMECPTCFDGEEEEDDTQQR